MFIGSFFSAGMILALALFACNNESGGGDGSKENKVTTTTYTVSKESGFNPATAHGDFTINGKASATAPEGKLITLVPTPVSADYKFASWAFSPPLAAAAVEGQAGAWTFTMPPNDLTVTAYFSPAQSPHTPGTGVKTMTVKGGMGKAAAYPNAVTNGEMYDGTRDITVTVTMASGAITDVTFEDSIEWKTQWYKNQVAENGKLRSNAAALVNAINTAKNADAAYTPNPAITQPITTAWNKYDTNIRKAVKDAVTAINAGKPNRILTGGGPNTPWLVDDVPLNGTATAAGVSYMAGNVQPSGNAMAPTDMTVTVTVTNGIITNIQVESDDKYCSNYGTSPAGGSYAPGGTIATSFNTWINSMKAANKMEVDTVSGASDGDNSAGAAPYKAASERFLKQIGQRAFMKLVNEY